MPLNKLFFLSRKRSGSPTQTSVGVMVWGMAVRNVVFLLSGWPTCLEQAV